MITRRAALRWLCVAAALGGAVPAAADAPAAVWKPAARRHLEVALQHFARQKYTEAAAELQAAHDLDPRTELLYALGQAHRLRGDCPTAVRFYQGFLAQSPSPAQADAARFNLKRCQRGAAPAAATGPAPPPGELVRPSSRPASDAMLAQPDGARPAAELVARERPPWYRDWTGHALCAAGTVLLATGVGLWVTGREIVDAAWRSDTYGTFAARQRELDGAAARQTGGVAAMAAGGVLVAAGGLHYWRRGPARPRLGLLPVLSPVTAALLATARF